MKFRCTDDHGQGIGTQSRWLMQVNDFMLTVVFVEKQGQWVSVFYVEQAIPTGYGWNARKVVSELKARTLDDAKTEFLCFVKP